MFSSTVRSISLVSACGITPIVRRASSGSVRTSYPEILATPEVMGMRVVIIRINVDLPAPFGPSRPNISPSFTKNETSSTAVNSPNFLTMWSTSMAFPDPFAELGAPLLATFEKWRVCTRSEGLSKLETITALPQLFPTNCPSTAPVRPARQPSFPARRRPWDYPSGLSKQSSGYRACCGSRHAG